jgi:tripartite-type tricarboxylate transporter receptor subunit TctC
MPIIRRDFLRLAAGTAMFSALPHRASAQGYPTRQVRILVGFAAGGGNDIAARIMGQWFAERLGQPFVIENRPGAGTNLATETVVRAPADGYTLLLVASSAAINATLYQKLNFNFIDDITPVAGIIGVPNVMYVHPSFPARTVSEFIDYAKTNPGKVTMASAGSGSSSHLAGEMFRMMTGVDLVHIPYRGNAPGLTDLLGGQVHVMFPTMPGTTDYVTTGKLRALAVTTATRSEVLPDVPTVGDFVPGYEASQWYGIGAPKNTPGDIVEMLNAEFIAGLKDPKMKTKVSDIGGWPVPMTPAAFGKFIADETEKWGKVIKFAGIKAD